MYWIAEQSQCTKFYKLSKHSKGCIILPPNPKKNPPTPPLLLSLSKRILRIAAQLIEAELVTLQELHPLSTALKECGIQDQDRI